MNTVMLIINYFFKTDWSQKSLDNLPLFTIQSSEFTSKPFTQKD